VQYYLAHTDYYVAESRVVSGIARVSRRTKVIGFVIEILQMQIHTHDVLSINVATGLQKIQGGRCAGIVFSVHATKYAMQ
jgi:hypothetical protein